MPGQSMRWYCLELRYAADFAADGYIGKQHLESTVPVSEPGLIILYIQRPWPVEINSRMGTNATHSD